MTQHLDCFGNKVEVGDMIAYTSSYNRGSTELVRRQITSFTKGGNPRIYVTRIDVEHYRLTGERLPIQVEKAITAKFCKTY